MEKARGGREKEGKREKEKKRKKEKEKKRKREKEKKRKREKEKKKEILDLITMKIGLPIAIVESEGSLALFL